MSVPFTDEYGVPTLLGSKLLSLSTFVGGTPPTDQGPPKRTLVSPTPPWVLRNFDGARRPLVSRVEWVGILVGRVMHVDSGGSFSSPPAPRRCGGLRYLLLPRRRTTGLSSRLPLIWWDFSLTVPPPRVPRTRRSDPPPSPTTPFGPLSVAQVGASVAPLVPRSRLVSCTRPPTHPCFVRPSL